MFNVFLRATVPPELLNKWFQHVRDFDISNPGCHFEVFTDGPEMPIEEMTKMMQVNPDLKYLHIFQRK